jgi:cell division protein FtsI/penicillin-binding protein 2
MAMTAGERLRVRFLFGALGAVPVFLTGWLGWLQVLQQGQLPREGLPPLRLSAAAADRQRDREHQLPSPRGAIVDRHGATLATDRVAFEVRAEVRPPRSARADVAAFRAWSASVVDKLASALTRDAGLADRRVALRQRQQELRDRIAAAFRLDRLPDQDPLPAALPARAEFLVDVEVDVLSVVEALQGVDDALSSLHLHLRQRSLRAYPERAVTYGLVGHLTDVPVREPATGRLLAYEPYAPVGLEAMAALQPGAPGLRAYHVDAKSRSFFAGPAAPPARASRVVATIDLELQKAALRELERQALAAGGQGTLPLWGALVLVETATGDVLAAASWHRDVHRKGAAFAPSQLLYEPGSIVKPLVFAFALQSGGLDWHQEFDCRSSGHDHRRNVDEANGRLVRDDHPCGVLTPHEILVKSSNIGAVRIGARLTREQWHAWFDAYAFGRPLGLPLPHQQAGGRSAKAWGPGVPAAQFRKWTASSLSIGYELQVNALQMARAYLTLLSGRQRQLRLVRSIDVDGVHHDVPVAAAGAPLFPPAVVEAVSAAMTDVVSDAEGATGRHLVAALRTEGVELHGLLAGKTGTAVSWTTIKGKGTVAVRNASFVGFVPAGSPRYLAVCVLQKDDGARFYGGSYAAPPAARLLLEALRLEDRRRLRLEPQVSASPGASGRGSAPERSQAGR